MKLYEKIYSTLQFLYKSTDTILDTILYQKSIHCNQSPVLDKILIYTDSINVWVDAWYDGDMITNTNDPELDRLLKRIDASLYRIHPLFDYYQIIISFTGDGTCML